MYLNASSNRLEAADGASSLVEVETTVVTFRSGCSKRLSRLSKKVILVHLYSTNEVKEANTKESRPR